MIPLGVAQLLAPGAIEPDLEVVPGRLADRVFGDPGRRLLEHHRLQRRPAARPDPSHHAPVVRAGDGRRDGLLLPRRADPAGAGHRRVDHRAGRGADAVGVDAAGGRLVTAARGEPTDVRPPVPPLRDGELPLSILIDYDGTISLTDVTDVVMAEHVPGNWEDVGRALRRRQDRLAPPDGVGGVDEFDTESGAALRDGRRAAPRPWLRAVHPAGSGGRRSRSRVVSDGFGFFIRPALERLGVGEVTGRHGADRLRGSLRVDRVPERAPACLVCGTCKRASCAGPPGRGPAGDVHRRRRERPIRRGLLRTSCSRSDRWSGSASRPAGRSTAGRRSARSTHGWLRRSRRSSATPPSSRLSRRGAPAARVLLRPRGVGRGPGRPT